MYSTSIKYLESLYPYSSNNEKEVSSYLRALTSINFAFKMDPEKFIKLVSYFIYIKEERYKTLQQDYFNMPEIILLMQSYIAKLRQQGGVTLSNELKLLRSLPEKITARLFKISPGTVLKSLYQLLFFSPNHEVALKILNQHPTFFISMLIGNKPPKLVFSKAVTNPIGLKLLAKKLSTEEFLTEFDLNDSKKLPPITTTTEGDAFYAKISETKLRLFTIVAEPLILSASLGGKLDYLFTNGPSELLSQTVPIIISLAPMNHLPECLIPYISAISTRFSTAYLGRIREPESLIKAIKLFEREAPHLFDSVATMVVKTPSVWRTLSGYINDLPELNLAIRNYLPNMLSIDRAGCIELCRRIQLTDKAAVTAINSFRQFMPESFGAIMNLSKSGELSFRVSAIIASADDETWIQFCEFYYGYPEYLRSFLSISTDLIIAGNFFRALELLGHLATHFAAGREDMNREILDYIYMKYATVSLNTIAEQSLFARVFANVHKFAKVIMPVLVRMPDLSSKCLILVIRYLWNSVKDEDPSFLLFRLRLLAKRYGTSKEPLAVEL